MKNLIFFFGLLFLISSDYALTFEEGIQAELVNNMMPVGVPTVSGNIVSITYDLSLSHGNETFARDSMFILGKLAKNYPESEYLEVVGMSGDEKIVSVRAKTRDVIDYAEMRTWSEGFEKTLVLTDYVSNCGSGKVKINGVCAQETKAASKPSSASSGETNELGGINPLLLAGGVMVLVGVGILFLLVIVVVVLLVKKKKK